MLKGLRNTLIVAGVMAGGVYLFYQYGLSDGAKNGLKFAYNAIKESSDLITSTIDNAVGIVVEDKSATASAEATRKQWEAIGF